MADAARALASVAQDQWKARDAFGTLGQTCRSCHDDYRMEKK
jgi:cytochrome c556